MSWHESERRLSLQQKKHTTEMVVDDTTVVTADVNVKRALTRCEPIVVVVVTADVAVDVVVDACAVIVDVMVPCLGYTRTVSMRTVCVQLTETGKRGG